MKICRQMAAADIKAVAQIEAAAFDDAWNANLLLQELNNALAHYIVLEAEGQTVAYAGFWLVAGEAQVTRVAVSAEARGRGYGAAIMAALIDRAWQLGAQAMTLEVRQGNLAAQRLYRGCGFVNAGIRPGYYARSGENAIIMWLYRQGNTHE